MSRSLIKIVAEIRVPTSLQAAELFADRLRDFILGPRMPGWVDNRCFTIELREVWEPEQCTSPSEMSTNHSGASLLDLQSMGLEIH